MTGWQEPIIAGVFEASSTSRPDQWFLDAIGGQPADAGIRVDSYTALTSGPVWQAVNIIAGDVGMLPINVFRQVADDRRELAKTHPAYKLLKVRPHPELTPSTFKETLESWALLWGNGVASIVRGGRGVPIALVPLSPDSVWVERDDNGQLWYMYRESATTVPFYPEEVLHIRGLGDPLWGYSVVTLAKNAIGMNLAMEKHGNRTFKNNARPSGVLEIPGKMDPENRTALRKEWEDMHRGVDNSGRIALLQGGMTFKATSISNENAQWLEAMRFSREQVASWFNLPAHKLNALERATFSNIEEQNRNYLNMSLSRWLVKWQEEAESKLFAPRERNSQTYSVRFNTGALLRGDLKSRYEAHSIGLNTGFLSVNDVRRTEDMDPIGPEGDVYLRPLNMEPSAEEEEEEEEDTTNNGVEASIRSGIRSEIDRLIGKECEAVRRAVKKGDLEYKTAAIDRLYNSLPKTMSKALQPFHVIAGSAGMKTASLNESIIGHCAESHQQVVDSLNNNDSEWGMLEYWPDRGQKLAAAILSEVNYAPV